MFFETGGVFGERFGSLHHGTLINTVINEDVKRKRGSKDPEDAKEG